MAIKVLVIGVGLGGCRFAEILSMKLTTSELKNNPIYMNISSEELNIFNSTYLNDKILIGKSYGAGKNRNFALDQFTENFNYEDLLDKIKKRVIKEDIDIIMVSFTTGGGTGSGTGTLLVRMLTNSLEFEKEIDKNVYVFGIALLPAFNEGISIFRNTLLSINDIDRGMKVGNRFMLIKNNATEGINFTEKCQYVNNVTSMLIADYFKGTTSISKDGVLDLNDILSSLSLPNIHSISKLKDGEIVKSPFITPNSAICKTMLCVIPEEASDIYENVVSSSGTILDFKYGYTTSEEGIVAHHGFNNLVKETILYRKRFDDLKALDDQGDVNTGNNSLSSLKKDVTSYDIKQIDSSKDKKEEIKHKSLKNIIDDYKNDE